LVDIYKYKPVVDLSTYKDYEFLDGEQMLKKASDVEIFYPAISKDSLYFYLTRGYLPEDNEISKKIEKWKKFEKMLDITQDLILLLYDNQKAYSESDTLYPNIESGIRLYDELLGLKDTPALISYKFGIDVAANAFNQEIMIYDKLYIYIQAFATQTPITLNGVRSLTLESVMGFSKNQWNEYMKKNFPQENIPYNNRSDFVMRTFYQT
jgi:hypothetical protein